MLPAVTCRAHLGADHCGETDVVPAARQGRQGQGVTGQKVAATPGSRGATNTSKRCCSQPQPLYPPTFNTATTAATTTAGTPHSRLRAVVAHTPRTHSLLDDRGVQGVEVQQQHKLVVQALLRLQHQAAGVLWEGVGLGGVCGGGVCGGGEWSWQGSRGGHAADGKASTERLGCWQAIRLLASHSTACSPPTCGPFAFLPPALGAAPSSPSSSAACLASRSFSCRHVRASTAADESKRRAQEARQAVPGCCLRIKLTHAMPRCPATSLSRALGAKLPACTLFESLSGSRNFFS